MAGTTRDCAGAAGRLARARPSSCSIRGGCTARARIRCTTWSSSRGSARSSAPISGLPGRWTGGAGLRRRDDRARAARDRPARYPRDQQDGRQARAEAALEFYQLGFEPVLRDLGRARHRASPICSTRSSSGLGRGARDHAEAEPDDGGRRSRRATRRRLRARPRRPTSRSSAGRTWASPRCVNRLLQRRARAGQRHAGHHARRHRRAADLAPPAVPHRRHGRACGGPAASAAAARWSWSASRGAKEAIADADVVALLIDANDRRDRPGRGHRRRGRPRRPRRRDHRQQVGPGEDRGPRVRRGVRR